MIEPGWVDTELQGHNEHPLVVEGMNKMIEQIDKVLEAEDIARAIIFAVTQPRARQHQRDADPARPAQLAASRSTAEPPSARSLSGLPSTRLRTGPARVRLDARPDAERTSVIPYATT